MTEWVNDEWGNVLESPWSPDPPPLFGLRHRRPRQDVEEEQECSCDQELQTVQSSGSLSHCN